MISLLLILTSVILLTGFLGVTVYETTRGVRFFEKKRTRFDRVVDQMIFVFEHVDFSAFAREEIRHVARRIGHAVATLSLQSVRAVERLSTRLVRSFRTHEASNAPRESTREFVKTLSDFKEQLKTTPPEVPEILS